jgi:hypothetical protein
MVTKSGRPVNVTIKVDQLVLVQARMRALLERTSVNRVLRQALEEYAELAVKDPAKLWPDLVVAQRAEAAENQAAGSSSAAAGMTSRPASPPG